MSLLCFISSVWWWVFNVLPENYCRSRILLRLEWFS